MTLLESTTLETQLRARFGTQASVNVYEISFPANASNIIYDPTMGSGESPYDSSTKGIAMESFLSLLSFTYSIWLI